MEGSRAAAADERFHLPGHEEQWSDSFYFAGGDGTGLTFYTRIGWRPNEDLIEAALGVWLPDGRFALAFAREPRPWPPLEADPGDWSGADPGPVACGGIAYECSAPNELWRLRFDVTARCWDRAEHLATARERYTELPIRGELRFACWTDPIRFGGLPAGVAAEHYEQPGSLAGVIEAGEVRHPLVGQGLRDHSWGVRDWQRVPFWRWMGMVVDPDNFVLIANVGTADGGEAVAGALMRGGRLAELAGGSVRAELDPTLGSQRRFEARARDRLGREAVLRGEAVSVAPLRQRRHGRVTLVNEGLTRLRWDRHSGLGISEFLFQQQVDAGQAAGLDAA